MNKTTVNEPVNENYEHCVPVTYDPWELLSSASSCVSVKANDIFEPVVLPEIVPNLPIVVPHVRSPPAA